MANKSVRIPTVAGGNDKYVTVRLENDVDFYEVLSLKISQKDIYGSFNSDYGVIVGRVIANGGVGIPNAKISVFIPISDEDKANPAIAAVYPYSSPRDKDLDGVRYNLLPRVAVNNPFLIAGDYAPKVPIGTFPTKEEITTNETFLDVYEKYYKFTTVTNTSGDYMIFGVPTGVQTVHMSVDITDIGKYSMNPSTMITNLGYSPQLFTENGTKVKYSTDLDTLPNVETQEVAVNVRPFWGDDTNFEIGITRQDFKVRALLSTSFTVFGAAFTDAQYATWGHNNGDNDITCLYRMAGDNYGLSIGTKRNGIMNETIFYIPTEVSDSEAPNNDGTGGASFSTKDGYKVLDPSLYTAYKENGQFAYILPCNRKKIITNDDGSESVVPDDNTAGVFTEFVGFFEFIYSNYSDLPIDRQGDLNSNTANQMRITLKFPQDTSTTLTATNTFQSNEADPTIAARNEVWRKQHYKFQNNKYYSIARFMGTASLAGGNNAMYIDPLVNVGVIMADSFPTNSAPAANNSTFEFPINFNFPNGDNRRMFSVQWLNFCAYIPQITYFPGRITNDGNQGHTTYLTPEANSTFYVNDNQQLIADSKKNTKWFGRADINRTAFILVPKEDILTIITQTELGASPQGFRNNQAPYTTFPLIGTDYKRIDGVQYELHPGATYFYKGLSSNTVAATNGNADVFLFLKARNLV